MAKKSEVEKRADLAEDLSEACEIERDLAKVVALVGMSLDRSNPRSGLALGFRVVYNSPDGERQVGVVVPAKVFRKRVLPALRLAVADAANSRAQLSRLIAAADADAAED